MTKNNQRDKCLLCERASQSRGLCTPHYLQFTRKRSLLSEESAAKWEEELIANGKLLPSKQGQREVPNAFSEDFEAFVRENPSSIKLPTEQPAAIPGVKAASAIESTDDEAELNKSIEATQQKHASKRAEAKSSAKKKKA